MHASLFSRTIRARAAFWLATLGAVGLLAPVHAATAASDAAFKPLKWADLINHPERWPAKTKIKVDQNFGKDVVKAGTLVTIAEVKGPEATVVAAKGFAFNAGPADCDLLEAANAQWAGFTPEQRALTPASINGDMSLWPAKVTLLQEASFGSYKLKEGEVLRLIKIDGGDVSLYVPGRADLSVVELGMTDLFSRARVLAALPREQRPGRMTELLDGLMVDASNQPIPVKPAEYYVQYWSASTCPRCAIFTPKFVEHYNTVLAGRNDVAFFGSSTDTTMPPYFAYVKRTNTPWPILPEQNKVVMMSLGNLGSIEIPGIIVFDKFGKVIMTTSRMKGPPLPVAEAALAKLDSQLPDKTARSP